MNNLNETEKKEKKSKIFLIKDNMKSTITYNNVFEKINENKQTV